MNYEQKEQEELWNSVNDELRKNIPTHRCNICGNVGTALIIKRLPDFDWSNSFPGDLNLRESLICIVCNSNSKGRMLVWYLGKYLNEVECVAQWKENKNVKILGISRLWPQHKYLKNKFNYHNEIFRDNTDDQTLIKIYTELEKISQPDESFDFILSSDTFEHVRLDMEIFKEVHRVLKKDGIFILQIPYCDVWDKSLIKVLYDGEKDIFLTKPEYHEEGLVYRIYGKELIRMLQQIGFSVEYNCIQIPEFMISLQPIIVCKKIASIFYND